MMGLKKAKRRNCLKDVRKYCLLMSAKLVAFVGILIEELDDLLAADMLRQSGVQSGKMLSDFTIDHTSAASELGDHKDHEGQDDETDQASFQLRASIKATIATIRMAS
jgi:hypothetical protein